MDKKRRDFCQSKHNKSGRFLEAALLCLLKEEASYGYNILEKLNDFGFYKDSPNLSTLYRQLNKMEDDSMVSSFWIESSEGPDKKIYKITDKGSKELDNWIKLLKDRQVRIQSIIKKYESAK